MAFQRRGKCLYHFTAFSSMLFPRYGVSSPVSGIFGLLAEKKRRFLGWELFQCFFYPANHLAVLLYICAIVV